MTDNFDYAINIVLEHEGGLSDDKHDPGGITNFGITLGFLKEFKEDPNQDGVIDKNDIINLTKEQAIALYRKHIWLPCAYNLIEDQYIATKVFDMAVNIGTYKSNHIFQGVLYKHGCPAVIVDEKINDKAINYVNCKDYTDKIILANNQFYNELRLAYKNYYIKLASNNPNLKWALHGWLNRAGW